MDILNYYRRWRKARDIGVKFVRTKDFSIPNSLTTHKLKRSLYFPNDTTYVELFKDIILDDEYKLSLLKDENIINIVDVGANLGMFSIAARISFINSKIHAYEPNPNNIDTLKKHGKEFNFKIYEEAVSGTSGKCDIDFSTENDTSAHIHKNPDGSVFASNLNIILKRFKNGKIDLLKLDCEGSEFDIFRNPEPLIGVRFISMEYHLPLNGSEKVFKELLSILEKLDFSIIYHNKRNVSLGIIVARNEV